jgi:predicted nuclease of predicted toxin-antitoxin system
MPQECLEERRFLLSEDLKLLLDESLGIKVYEKLKSMNFNVQSVIAERRGIKDMEVVTMAKLHNKVIATMDKDFGYLALSYSPPGVILLRLRDPRIRVLLKLTFSTAKAGRFPVCQPEASSYRVQGCVKTRA